MFWEGNGLGLPLVRGAGLFAFLHTGSACNPLSLQLAISGTIAPDIASGRVVLETRQTYPELLRDLRRRLGNVSQEALARRVGVSWSTINRWENGRGVPSPLAREKLLALLEEVGLKRRSSGLVQGA